MKTQILNFKSVITSLALVLIFTSGSIAQKISTRSGYISFFSETPVEDIKAVNNQVSSVVNLENGQFAFLAPIKAFVFEKALMQEHFNENYMESGKFPNASFKGQIEGYEKIDLSEDGEYQLVFAGIMTIHGVEKKMKEPVNLKVKDGKVSLDTEFHLKVSDFKIDIPSSKQDNISNQLLVTVKMEYES